MHWGSLVAAALLLTLAIGVLRALHWWLIILLTRGPGAYAGIVVGNFIGTLAHDAGVGLLVAIMVMGLVSALARSAVDIGTRWLHPEPASAGSASPSQRRSDRRNRTRHFRGAIEC